MKNSFILIILISIFIASCSSSKNVSTGDKVKSISLNTLVNKLEKREARYDWFSAKIKLNYNDGKLEQSFTANVRMKKDSVIWMSLTGFLGLEGGRILITKDSVQVIDRLNKKYYKFPLSMTTNYIPLEVDLAQIQGMIAGNRFFINNRPDQIKIENSMYMCSLADDLVMKDLFVHPKNYTCSEMRLKHRFEKQKVIYKFDDYKDVDKQLFSHSRKLEIENGDKQLLIAMDFSKIDLGKIQSFPFEVPSRYEKLP